MSEETELKSNIIQNIIDKKFTKANSEFGDFMRNKAYAAIDNFKQSFKYVTHEIKPEEAPKED
tara:strand:- start:426 stop:614 length:189 start_codon:yes stop_codon:yes gene_type:complete